MSKPSDGKARKTGRKNRKWGRNKRAPSNQKYIQEQRWIVNKIKKLLRIVKKFPNDLQSQDALNQWTKNCPLHARKAEDLRRKELNRS